MAKSQENNVVITCEHRRTTTKPTDFRRYAFDTVNRASMENLVSVFSRPKVKIIVRYEEWERRIKCGEKDNETSPYIKNEKALRVLGDFNPVDCEACKSVLSEYLKFVVLHPNPDEMLQDMYEKVSSIVRKVAENKQVLEYSKVYEIVNHVERHCMSHNNEWLITWIDYRKQQPQPHPLPLRAMEPVKVGGLYTEGEGFTCAICLEGVKGKKRKRTTSIKDDVKEEKQHEEEPESNGANRVVRLLSCHHMYHKTCIDRWLKDGGHDTCPLCRFLLPKTSRCRFNWDLAKKKALDNSKIVKLCNKE